MEPIKSRARAAVNTTVAAVSLLALFLAPVDVARAQSCTWAVSPDAPPAATALRAHRIAFHAPTRVAVDSGGNVYVTDPRMGEVTVLDPYGRLSALFGGFDVPVGIAVDQSGRIYVGEQGSGSVAVFDPQWNFLYFLGAGDGEFLLPNDIAIDAEYGWVYVVDSDAHLVKVYASDGAFLFAFGGKGTGPGQFGFPTGIYITPVGVSPSVEVYVADRRNDRIQVLDRDGIFQRCIGGGGFSFQPKFGTLQGLTGDAQGRLYVADAFQGYVQVFDPFGRRVSTIGSFGEGAGQLRTPMDVALDPFNRLLVTSANNARVELYGIDAFTDPREKEQGGRKNK
jgi:DNA-binding beta-propeller fold protein YncE